MEDRPYTYWLETESEERKVEDLSQQTGMLNIGSVPFKMERENLDWMTKLQHF